jgi:hypothetical protein
VTGAPTPDPDLPDFWLSIDLVGVPVTFVSAGGGDCEGMGSVLTIARGSSTLEDFFDDLELGFGIRAIDDADPTIVAEWEKTWDATYSKTYGAWDDILPYTAAGAFSMGTDGPHDVCLAPTYWLEAGSWQVQLDPWGSAERLDISGATSAPTAYYETMSVYLYRTGF